MLKPADFYLPSHERLFETLTGILREQGEVDAVLAGNTLDANLARVMGECVETAAGGAAGVERYCRIVLDRAADRRALAKAETLVKAAHAGAGRKALGERIDQGSGLDELDGEIEDEIAGRRRNLDWPQFPTLTMTRALLPGSMTPLCGSPGSSKSMLLLQLMWEWHLNGIPVAFLCLEKGRAFHLRRALAQIQGNEKLTNDAWARANPELVREAKADPRLASFAPSLEAPDSNEQMDVEYLLDWLRHQAACGKRIIGIDPVTIIDSSARPWDDHKRFVRMAGQIVTRYKASLVVVTHARDDKMGKVLPKIENMRGGAAWGQFTDTGLWLEAHPHKESVVTRFGDASPDMMQHNRTLYITKVRMGPGSGLRLAVGFDVSNLRHAEMGKIVEE